MGRLGLSVTLLFVSAASTGWLALPGCAQAAEDTARLATIAKELSDQDDAWDDVHVRYTCDWWSRGDDGKYRFEHRREFQWQVTQKAWEKFSCSYPAEGENEAYTSAASYDGEYHMTSSSQGQGSGTVGHGWHRFLQHPNHIKKLGLTVSGLELNQPLSVQGFLTSKEAAALIDRVQDGLTVARGADPFAEGLQIHLWLDPRLGYRPVKIEVTDKRGLVTRFDGMEYRKLAGARGTLWFPVRGIWNCVDSKKRTVNGQYRFEVIEIQVDKKLTRDDFILTFPKGALFLNGDTGESGYLRSAISATDASDLSGKLMSYQEHDAALPNREGLEQPGRWLIILAVNAALVLLLAVVVRVAQRRSRRPVGPSPDGGSS